MHAAAARFFPEKHDDSICGTKEARQPLRGTALPSHYPQVTLERMEELRKGKKGEGEE